MLNSGHRAQKSVATFMEVKPATTTDTITHIRMALTRFRVTKYVAEKDIISIRYRKEDDFVATSSLPICCIRP